VQVDDAYLGGERTGGKAGRGSENKTPFVPAVSMEHPNPPTFVKFSPVPGFTLKVIAVWARNNLSPDCSALSAKHLATTAFDRFHCLLSPHRILADGAS
jgi:hypothetical protein